MRLRRRQVWGAGVVVASIGLLMLVALAAEQAPFDVPDDTGPLRAPSIGEVLFLAAVVAMVGGAIVLAVSATRVSGHSVPARRRRSVLRTLAGVVAVVALLLLLGALRSDPRAESTVDQSAATTVVDAPTEEAGRSSDPPWVAISLGVAVLLALGAAAAFGRRFDDFTETPDAEPDPRALAEASLVRSLDVLAQPGDDRAAIIAAYAALLDGLAAAGIPRHRAEAPEEYMTRVLRAAHVAPVPLRALTDLFAEARFSEHRMGPADRSRAVAALDAVRRDLHEQVAG